MTLAEALQKRGAIIEDIYQLKERLERNALVQEGEEPMEDPSELKRQMDALFESLDYMIQKINLTNCSVKIEGKTITELLARRDVLKKKFTYYERIIAQASCGSTRARFTEIKIKTPQFPELLFV